MIIRLAEIRDIEELLILAWEMHQESKYKALDYNIEKTALFFEQAIECDDFLVLVVDDGAALIGGFVGFVKDLWFTDDLTASDLGLFMLKEKRGSSAPIKLIKHFVSWAKEKGVNPEFIEIGISTRVNVERTQKLYESIGFETVGPLMTYRAGL